MISASGLRKSYGEFEAVRGLDFEVPSGEVVGLLGPNGAGKTTTIRLLTTFLSPSGGSAMVAGFDVVKEADKVREQIGYLPETPPLYPEMRVEEYLDFVASIKGVSSKEKKEAIPNILERCGLTAVSKKLCGELSKGFKQRVGLAQAIVHNPKVIILDEPTSGLDPAQIVEIRQLIAELRNDHTVILSTHILPEVSQTCSRVMIVANGKLVTQGTLEELTAEESLEDIFLRSIVGDADE